MSKTRIYADLKISTVKEEIGRWMEKYKERTATRPIKVATIEDTEIVNAPWSETGIYTKLKNTNGQRTRQVGRTIQGKNGNASN